MVALSEVKVAEYAKEHFVGTYEKVGSFRVSKALAMKSKRKNWHKGDYLSKQGGNIVTYFCTPDMEVINFVIGPVQPATLLREAKWAVETYRQARQNRDATSLKQAVREAHHARLSEPTRQHYNVTLRQLGFFEHGELNDAARRAVVQASVSTGHQVLRQATREPAKDPAELLRTRQNLRALQTQQKRNHLVLSRLGLARLPKLEKPIFELLARQPYGRRSTRQDAALSIARKCAERKQPLLIAIISPHRRSGDTLEAFDRSGMLPKHRGVLKQLESYKIIGLTYNETNSLADDLNQAALPRMRNIHSVPRFVILDATGKRTATLLSGNSGWYIHFDNSLQRPYHRYMGAAFLAALRGPSTVREKALLAGPGFRTFRSRHGNYALAARFVSANGDGVQLLTSDGRKITVTLSQLCVDDQKYLRRVIAAARRNRERLRDIAGSGG